MPWKTIKKGILTVSKDRKFVRIGSRVWENVPLQEALWLARVNDAVAKMTVSLPWACLEDPKVVRKEIGGGRIEAVIMEKIFMPAFNAEHSSDPDIRQAAGQFTLQERIRLAAILFLTDMLDNTLRDAPRMIIEE